MKPLLDKIKAMAEFDKTKIWSKAMEEMNKHGGAGQGQAYYNAVMVGAQYQHSQDQKLILAQNKVIEMLVGALEEHKLATCRCIDTGISECWSCETLEKTKTQVKAKLKNVIEGKEELK